MNIHLIFTVLIFEDTTRYEVLKVLLKFLHA
eukprot:Gb_30859 [translate_table: standard]